MTARTIYNFLTVSFIVCSALVPAVVSASTMYVETASSTVSVGDTVVVKAYVDSSVASANVLSGDISLSLDTSSFKVDGISTGRSVLTIWPTTPALSADGTQIPFNGGVAGGFSGSHQFLFSIILTVIAPGEISFTPENTTLYLNNGLGTAEPVADRTFTLSAKSAPAGYVPYDGSQGLLSQNTTPPAPFSIVESQNPSLFSGKKFISFQATDAESGIDYYTVKEGNAAPVRSGTLYVLTDQTSTENIIVYAYDNAGNIRTSSFTTSATNALNIPLIAIIVVLLIAFTFFVWKYLRRRRIS